MDGLAETLPTLRLSLWGPARDDSADHSLLPGRGSRPACPDGNGVFRGETNGGLVCARESLLQCALDERQIGFNEAERKKHLQYS